MGAAVLACSVATPGYFLRKYLTLRDLKSLVNKKCSSGTHNTPCRAAPGAADLERPAGEAPPPPRQGCSVCRLCQTVLEMWYTMVSEVVRELLGFPLGCRRFFVGVVGRTSDSRSSDLSSRAAPRCLFCAWVSDLRFKCLFSTFLSTSLDDFEALGANFTLLERSWSLLGRIWGGPGGGLGGLGAPFGGSGAVWGGLVAILRRHLEQSDF